MRKRFEALELALVIITRLRKLLPVIRRHDPKLHTQLREAGSSMPMNLAEGNRRRGKDRILWSVAAGSADEVHTGLRTAVAWGYLREEFRERSPERARLLARHDLEAHELTGIAGARR